MKMREYLPCWQPGSEARCAGIIDEICDLHQAGQIGWDGSATPNRPAPHHDCNRLDRSRAASEQCTRRGSPADSSTASTSRDASKYLLPAFSLSAGVFYQVSLSVSVAGSTQSSLASLPL